MSKSGGITLKSAREISLMRTANIHVAEILELLVTSLKPGMTTWDLEEIVRREIARRQVKSAFLGYHGYPAMLCVSVNEEVVHGIPNKRKVLKNGDLVSLDMGVIYEGYVGDAARSVVVGTGSAEAQKLLQVTSACLQEAIKVCKPTQRLSDIGKAVQEHAEAAGFSVVRDFVGHGIGTKMHEEPQVLNYYAGLKPYLQPGMVIAIEPMVNVGTYEVEVLADNWTVVTKDRRLSAHFEHSIAITEGEPIVLSSLETP